MSGSIRIRQGKRGTSIRASGSAARAVFDAFAKSVGEPAPFIAYCWANGLIEFGSRVPDGAIEIARGDVDLVRTTILATARHGKRAPDWAKRVQTAKVEEVTLLVSGIPEAESPQAAGDALIAYLLWLKQREREGFQVAIKTPLEGPLNPFYAGSGFGDDAYYNISADDRITAVQRFNTGQCRIALMLPDLQKTVRTAVERRLRKLEQENAA